MNNQGLNILAELAAEIESRRTASPHESYTAKLLSEGPSKCAKKFGEEAVEAALAAVAGDKAHIASESADVLYHLLVMLQSVDVPLSDVMGELARRRGTSGIAEKASRPKD